MDEVDNSSENNWGLMKRDRGSFTDTSAEIGLVGVSLCDLFNTKKLLLDNLK